MIDYGSLKVNGVDARNVGCKKEVVSGGIGPEKSEGGVSGNRRGGGGRIDRWRIRGNIR